LVNFSISQIILGHGDNPMKNQSKTKQTLIQKRASLDEASEYAENIIDTVREPLIVLDQDLRVVTASRSFYEFFKVKPEETEGKLIYNLGNKQWDIPKLRELLEDILPQKTTFDNYEVEHDFTTIGKRIMLLNARQIKRVLGKERIILLAIEDITERRLIEKKVLLAAIVQSSKDAIIGKSLDGIITSWNKGAEELYGYTESEIIGKSISVLIPPDIQDELPEILRKIKLGENIESYETVRQRKDGQDIYVSITVSAIYDDEGSILGASSLARDITERKRLENLLIESETQYRLLFETANDGILLIEKNEGKIAHINPSAEKMLGYSARESIGNKLQDVGLIIDHGDFQITMKNLNKRGILRYNDVPVKTKSGKQIYTDTYLVDKAKFAQCNIRDISERKKAQEALLESEERFRRLANATWEGIVIHKEGTIMDANESAAKILGYSIEDIIGKNIITFIAPESIEPVMQKFSEGAMHDQLFLELKVIRKDKAILSAEALGRPIRYKNIDARVLAFRDITDRKRTELALRESEDRYRSLYVDSGDSIMVLSPDQGFIAANPATIKLFACRDEQDFTTRSPASLSPEYQPDGVRSMDKSHEMIRMALEKGSHFFEWMHRRADGTDFLATVLLSRLESGSAQLLQATVRDITEHKQAEAELQQTLDSLKKAVGATIQVMVSAVEMRDPYTAGHQIRVADLARAIATGMGLPQDKIEGIRMAGSIHDIGKLSIPSEILSKPTKLTDLEFSLIKVHSRSGYEMLKDVESPWPLAQIVYQHHERMNGSGYPRNLKGDEIIIEARIMAVADVVEAMASHRPYRPALGIEAALEEIVKNKGILYDNTVAEACLRLFREKGYKFK
jgi:PAS domain S-box-containing protein